MNEPTQLHQMRCASCKRAIVKGERYATVNLPEGGTASVHAECMGAENKSAPQADAVPELGLLKRVADAESILGAVPMGGAHADDNLRQGLRALEAAERYARKHDKDDVAQSLSDLRPLLERDAERGCTLLRELRISIRIQLDGATDAAGLPRVPPGAVQVRTPQRRRGPKVGRNQPCPCGSGKKHKKCCGRLGSN